MSFVVIAYLSIALAISLFWNFQQHQDNWFEDLKRRPDRPVKFGGDKDEFLDEKEWRDFEEIYRGDEMDIINNAELKVRLLRIQPSEDLNSEIACDFKAERLGSTKCPRFFALSYSWESWPAVKPKDKPRIIVRGNSIRIGQNLYWFLQEFRRRQSEEGLQSSHIWVDELCIKQRGIRKNSEKNFLIKEMRRIYRSAEKTIAWIGPEENGSSELFRTLEKAMDPIHHLLPQATEEDMVLFREYWRQSLCLEYQLNTGIEVSVSAFAATLYEDNGEVIETYEKLDAHFEKYKDLEEVESIILSHLKPVFWRPFWHRKWIIQEIAASREIDVWCGGDTIKWDHFTAPLQPLMELTSSVDDEKGYQGLGNMRVMCGIRDHLRSGRPAHLIDITKLAERFKVSDLVDHVFSLLGLAFDAELHVHTPYYDREGHSDLLKQLSNRLEPIFKIDEKAKQRFVRGRRLYQIQCEMSANWISATHNTDLLCLTHGREDDPLPSWCPHWTRMGPHDKRFLTYICGDDRRRGVNSDSHQFRASGSSKYYGPLFFNETDSKPGMGGLSLKIPSIHLGKIFRILKRDSTVAASKDRHAHWSRNKHLSIPSIYETLVVHMPYDTANDQSSDLRFLWQDTVRDLVKWLWRPPQPLQANFDAKLTKFLEWINAVGAFIIGGVSIKQAFDNNTLKEDRISRALIPTETKKRRKFRARLFSKTPHAQEETGENAFSPSKRLFDLYVYIYDVIRALRQSYDEGANLCLVTGCHLGWAHPNAKEDDEV
ncbi:MAG: hypothetical protein M1822_002562 [Bathelium mastoideum]|nr:MAG: hypothetical protein M1822_002562 [Bathelium mastoideum]